MQFFWPNLYRPRLYITHYTSVYYSNAGGDGLCWIGLSKSASDHSYYWLDGNPSTYRNWEDTEPNENTGCVRIAGDGKFRDYYCDRKYRYVCKGI